MWGFSFVTRDSQQSCINQLVESGVVPRLVQLLEHEKVQVSVPTVRTVGNILASEEPRCSQAVIQAGILQVYARLIDHPKQIMRKEIAWSLANVTAESAEMVQECLKVGIIQSLI